MWCAHKYKRNVKCTHGFWNCPRKLRNRKLVLFDHNFQNSANTYPNYNSSIEVGSSHASWCSDFSVWFLNWFLSMIDLYSMFCKRRGTLFISLLSWLAGCRSTYFSMSKIKVRISEIKYLSFYKSLGVCFFLFFAYIYCRRFLEPFIIGLR